MKNQYSARWVIQFLNIDTDSKLFEKIIGQTVMRIRKSLCPDDRAVVCNAQNKLASSFVRYGGAIIRQIFVFAVTVFGPLEFKSFAFMPGKPALKFL
ncbi:MAG: hypothetical protein QM472_00910, partial [Spirochaetota bacterium]|nr:hypothetical protein [Spirochaetota bacterium]